MSDLTRYDVGIVGYGPVGATMATLLAREGLALAVFERDSAPYALPRAGHFDGEIMRVLQTAGIADGLAPSLAVGVGMKFLAADGRLLVNWPRPQEIGPQDWHASYRFYQPELEAHLRAAFEAASSHPARLSCEVTGLEQEADGVRLTVADRVRGTTEEIRCRYVVACDGARSMVRQAIGSSIEDLGSHDSWLVVDVLLHAPVPSLEDATLQICDPARPTTVARASGLRRRWEFKIMPGDDRERIAEPDSVWRLIAPWVGPEHCIVERAVVYTFHGILARGWRAGRVLLAGDAAHQTPPFMGQGLCAGIRDASNLAWKLVDVVRGRADPSLLDSYEAERGPHVRAFVQEAIRLGDIVQVTDPEEVAARDRQMAENPEFLRTITPRLGSGLAGNAPEPVGTLAPQPRLASGERMDDVVGLRFALLVAPDLFAEVPASLRARLASLDVVVLPGEGAAWLAELGVRAAMIRPDRYVLAVAQDVKGIAAMTDLLGFRTAAELAA